MKFLTLVMSLICLQVNANRPNMFLLAEKSLPTGMHQTSVEFYPDEVVFVTNSNLWIKYGEGVSLGMFTSKKTPALSALEKKLIDIQKDRPKTEKRRSYKSPHATKLKLEEHEVGSGEPAFADAINFFPKIWAAGEWKAKSAVKVLRNKKGGLEVKAIGATPARKTAKPDTCMPENKEIELCEIQSFGYVYFKRAKN